MFWLLPPSSHKTGPGWNVSEIGSVYFWIYFPSPVGSRFFFRNHVLLRPRGDRRSLCTNPKRILMEAKWVRDCAYCGCPPVMCPTSRARSFSRTRIFWCVFLFSLGFSTSVLIDLKFHICATGCKMRWTESYYGFFHECVLMAHIVEVFSMIFSKTILTGMGSIFGRSNIFS